MQFTKEDIASYITYRTSRSSGSGGQHVNKVETRVTASLDIYNCPVLTEDQKQLLGKKLKLSNDGTYSVSSEKSRSQLKNKEIATKLLVDAVFEALRKPKKRKPTKPSKSAVKKRLEEKKRLGEKKSARKKGWD